MSDQEDVPQPPHGLVTNTVVAKVHIYSVGCYLAKCRTARNITGIYEEFMLKK